jgi:hypothetical protein
MKTRPPIFVTISGSSKIICLSDCKALQLPLALHAHPYSLAMYLHRATPALRPRDSCGPSAWGESDNVPKAPSSKGGSVTATAFGLFGLMLLLQLSSFGQSDRAPDSQEKKAIDKAVAAVTSIITRFADTNWEKTGGGPEDPADYAVQKKPNVPIGVAPFDEWHYSVRQGSPLWNSDIKVLLAALLKPPDPNDKKAMAAYEAADRKFKNEKDLFVEVHVNEKKLPVNPVPSSSINLKIPGCYFAYKQSPDKLIGTDRNLESSFVLAFGNWGNTRVQHYGNITAYEFHFLHPPSTPYIENIVIILSGNQARIGQLLSTLHWDDINRGLTL